MAKDKRRPLALSLRPSFNPIKGHQRGTPGEELGTRPEVRGNFMRAELERQTPLESDRPRANEAVADLGVLGRFGMASWEGAQSIETIHWNKP